MAASGKSCRGCGHRGAAVSTITANAQQPAKVWRVGWIWIGRAGSSAELAGFRQGLKDFGYVEGKNIIVEYRFAEGRRDGIADLVNQLMQTGPDVLVGMGDPVVIALKNATTTIPIVFLTGDPLAAGYVTSIARPGGNMTGVSMMQGIAGLTVKRIQFLKEIVPSATQLGLMFNPDSLTTAGDLCAGGAGGEGTEPGDQVVPGAAS